MDSRDQFDQWVAMWDKAQAKFAGQPAQNKPSQTHSYFGLQQMVPNEDADPAAKDVSDWQSIFDRSGSMTDGQVLSEAMKLAKGPGQGVKFQKNPVHFASTGMDQSPSPNQPVRVTPNFTDGPQLSELIELKTKLSKLEAQLQAADIGKAHAAATPGTYDGSPVGKSYQGQIDDLWKKINALSEKLTPEPQEDDA